MMYDISVYFDFNLSFLLKTAAIIFILIYLRSAYKWAVFKDVKLLVGDIDCEVITSQSTNTYICSSFDLILQKLIMLKTKDSLYYYKKLTKITSIKDMKKMINYIKGV